MVESGCPSNWEVGWSSDLEGFFDNYSFRPLVWGDFSQKRCSWLSSTGRSLPQYETLGRVEIWASPCSNFEERILGIGFSTKMINRSRWGVRTWDVEMGLTCNVGPKIGILFEYRISTIAHAVICINIGIIIGSILCNEMTLGGREESKPHEIIDPALASHLSLCDSRQCQCWWKIPRRYMAGLGWIRIVGCFKQQENRKWDYEGRAILSLSRTETFALNKCGLFGKSLRKF